MTGRCIDIDITAQNELTIGEVWPDGDQPEHPTAADVVALLKARHGVRQNLNDWSLFQDLEVVVTVSIDGVVTQETILV